MLGRCGCKRDEVTGDRRRLHREEHHDRTPHQYYSRDKIKKNEIGEACGTWGGEERCIQGLGGET